MHFDCLVCGVPATPTMPRIHPAPANFHHIRCVFRLSAGAASPAMTPVSHSDRGRFDARSSSFDLASMSSTMGSVYGEERDEVSVDSGDTGKFRASSPAPRSERKWKVCFVTRVIIAPLVLYAFCMVVGRESRLFCLMLKVITVLL